MLSILDIKMIKPIYKILLIICVLIGCISEKRYHVDETTNPNDTIFYLKGDMTLLNGLVYSNFGDVGKYLNGKKEGIHKTWYDNGQLKSFGKFRRGKKEGVNKEWYDGGQLKETWYYLDGKRVGLCEFSCTYPFDWDYIYDVNSIDGKNGVIQSLWYKNGNPSEELNFQTGEWLYWSEDGQVLLRGEFKNGKKDGIHKTWFDDGVLKSYEYYNDGKREGVHKSWYENGQLNMVWSYKNDTLDGYSYNYYKNGVQSYEKKYDLGVLMKSISRTPDGKFLSKHCFDEGRNRISCE